MANETEAEAFKKACEQEAEMFARVRKPWKAHPIAEHAPQPQWQPQLPFGELASLVDSRFARNDEDVGCSAMEASNPCNAKLTRRSGRHP
jgi:hypothetical protein